MLPSNLKDGDVVYITAEDIAEILQLKPQTIYTWTRQGFGPPCVRLGPRIIRYRSDEFEAWLEANRANQEPKRWKNLGG